ncbi:MAG: hypothetical protein EOO33_13385 [Comamonadaceae bacterium]|nr:MAG: hypothetical protein EOO33_13385 [Comamonadaceae bacterium]
MTQRRSLYAIAASAGVALALLVGPGVAQARSDVSWSIGVGVPGVVVGAGGGYAPPPVYYAPPPRPVYYAPPAPVYYAPPPVYYSPPPRPVYYAPPVVVSPYGYYRGGPRHHRHDRGHDRGHGRRDWR